MLVVNIHTEAVYGTCGQVWFRSAGNPGEIEVTPRVGENPGPGWMAGYQFYDGSVGLAGTWREVTEEDIDAPARLTSAPF